MHRDPERRYQTVDALQRDMGRFLADEPLDARGDDALYRLRKFVQAHRAAVAVVSAVLTTIILPVAFYTVRVAAARTEAEESAARSARIQRFLVNLFEGGDPDAGPTDDLRVVTLLESGVAEARAMNTDPLLQAELLRTLGSIFQKFGRFDEADELLTSALETQRALLEDGDAELLDSTIALGLLRIDQGRLGEAEDLIRAANTRLSGTQVERGRIRSRTALALAQVLEARGRYAEAIAVGADAVRRSGHADDPGPDDVAALGQLADSHYYAGHYEVADLLNTQILEWTRKLYGERHPRVADTLVNLGASLNDRGRYADAEELFRRALEISTAFYGTASGMTMLGRALVYQQELAEGVPLCAPRWRSRSASTARSIRGWPPS